jgi:phosphohistidine phosphatase SixA
LTPAGEAELESIGRGLAATGSGVRLVVTSPARRCRQSAEILAAALGLPPERLRPLDELAGGVPAARLRQQLRGLADEAPLLAVGHEPQLVELAAALLGGPAVLHFACGACASFELQRGGPKAAARLEWLLTPSQLVRLAGPEA